MKRVIYMALTLASALSLGGCSSAITSKDLTMIEDAETTMETTKSMTIATELSNLTIEIEGNKEVVPVRKYNSSLGYQIQMDDERFTYEAQEGADIYTAVNPDASVYPDVYIKITKTNKIDQIDYLRNLKDLLLKENSQTKEISDQKIGTYDVEGFHLSFGNEYNSAIKIISVIETIASYYTIETHYFLEAAEGYGARIKALLDTFTLDDK
jgi:hypothetical protein